ncbi:TetR family transcriptional regulator [Lederbergia ruris]|uniref:TetR family transcriptional regulator n=1 Tax=Lederbergia ruris TaxID=217495 RepID=A0ABQ4KH96_9BACI|nr:TetR/AcrR family transcriptional regulator [Lederbergia ruris]GIN57334.1 TetR family transcriptional regulator [Lederbergia ruris]
MRKKKELTSNQLIEAAFELFAQHGIEKTSLAMIATKVGITKPSIYYHFASKEELIDRIFEYSLGDYQFDHFVQIDECNEQNFAKKLYQAGLRMFPEKDEIYLRVLNEFMSYAVRNEKYLKRIAKFEQEFIEGFQDLLQKGADLGIVKPQNIAAKAHMLAIVIDGIQDSIVMQMPFKTDYKDIWREVVNSVLTKNQNEFGEDEQL